MFPSQLSRLLDARSVNSFWRAVHPMFLQKAGICFALSARTARQVAFHVLGIFTRRGFPYPFPEDLTDQMDELTSFLQ